MTRYLDITFHSASATGHDAEGRTPDYKTDDVGFAIEEPDGALAEDQAKLVEDACSDTYDHLMDAVTKWAALRDHYTAADTDKVLRAMDPVIEKLVALKRAGRTFHSAVSAYKESISEVSSTRSGYNTWVSGWYPKWIEHLSSTLSAEEYEEKYGSDAMTRQAALKSQRREHEASGSTKIITTLNTARATLSEALKAIDMEALGEIRISSTPEAISTIPTVDALEERIKNSHVFSDIDGMDSRADEIADAVWNDVYQDLPTDYIDSHGTHWVFGPDGEAVRVGSAMDPNLNAAIWEAMNNDPVLSDATVDMPGTSFGASDAGGVATWAGGLGANEGTVAGYDRLVNGIDTGPNPASSSVAKGLGKGVAGAPLDVFALGLDVGQQKHAQGVQSPLLSDAEAGDRSSRYATKQVVSTVAGVAGGGTAVVVTGATGGAGILVGAGAGAGASKASDAVLDGPLSKTWSIEELEEKYKSGEIKE